MYYTTRFSTRGYISAGAWRSSPPFPPGGRGRSPGSRSHPCTKAIPTGSMTASEREGETAYRSAAFYRFADPLTPTWKPEVDSARSKTPAHVTFSGHTGSFQQEGEVIGGRARSGRRRPCIWGTRGEASPGPPGSRRPGSAIREDVLPRPARLSLAACAPAPRAPASSQVFAPLSLACLPGPPGSRRALSSTGRTRPGPRPGSRRGR